MSPDSYNSTKLEEKNVYFSPYFSSVIIAVILVTESTSLCYWWWSGQLQNMEWANQRLVWNEFSAIMGVNTVQIPKMAIKSRRNKKGFLWSVNVKFDQALLNEHRQIQSLHISHSFPLKFLNLQGMNYLTKLVANGMWWWSLYPAKVERLDTSSLEKSMKDWLSKWKCQSCRPSLYCLLFGV